MLPLFDRESKCSACACFSSGHGSGTKRPTNRGSRSSGRSCVLRSRTRKRNPKDFGPELRARAVRTFLIAKIDDGGAGGAKLMSLEQELEHFPKRKNRKGFL